MTGSTRLGSMRILPCAIVGESMRPCEYDLALFKRAIHVAKAWFENESGERSASWRAVYNFLSSGSASFNSSIHDLRFVPDCGACLVRGAATSVVGGFPAVESKVGCPVGAPLTEVAERG